MFSLSFLHAGLLLHVYAHSSAPGIQNMSLPPPTALDPMLTSITNPHLTLNVRFCYDLQRKYLALTYFAVNF